MPFLAPSGTVEVRNCGHTVVRFSLRARPGGAGSALPPWLLVAPMEGEIEPGKALTLQVHVGDFTDPDALGLARAVSPAPLSARHHTHRAGDSARGEDLALASGRARGMSVPSVDPAVRAAVGTPARSLPFGPAAAAAASSPPAASFSQAGRQQQSPPSHAATVSLDEVLVLHVEHGKDYFIPVAATFPEPHAAAGRGKPTGR